MNMEEYSEGRFLLDFYADWCGPCNVMKPIIEEFDNSVEDIEVKQINVDEEFEIASAFGVRNIPLFIYIEDGEIISKGLGSKTLDQLKEMTNS